MFELGRFTSKDWGRIEIGSEIKLVNQNARNRDETVGTIKFEH